MATDPLYHLSPVWTHLTTVQPVRGEGIYLYDADGKRYIDFTSGIGVTNTGHSHPRVVAAIQQQAANLIHGQINIVIAPAAIELANLLNEITPPSIDSFFLSNSGAEAVEGAIKLARQATKRQNVIVFQGSFHGRTAQTMAMTTSKTGLSRGLPTAAGRHLRRALPLQLSLGHGRRRGERLLPQPVEHAAQVADRAGGDRRHRDRAGAWARAATSPRRRASCSELRDLCDHYGILLIADEVQSGFGRTGKLFGFEHSGVTPDVVIMAKGLGSGMPISAIGASRELMEKWTPGSHGGTYGGNALAAAAGAATIKVIRDEDLPGNAARTGERLINGLRELQAEFPGHRRRARARLDGRRRVRRARSAGQGYGKGGAKSLPGAKSAAADLRHLRQRDPLDSAAGRDQRADRRGADAVRASAGERFRLAAH